MSSSETHEYQSAELRNALRHAAYLGEEISRLRRRLDAESRVSTAYRHALHTIMYSGDLPSEVCQAIAKAHTDAVAIWDELHNAIVASSYGNDGRPA